MALLHLRIFPNASLGSAPRVQKRVISTWRPGRPRTHDVAPACNNLSHPTLEEELARAVVDAHRYLITTAEVAQPAEGGTDGARWEVVGC